MRTAQIVTLLSVLGFAASALAAERCQEISDLVVGAVMVKPKIAEVLRKNPQKGTLGEPWRYLWFINKERLDALRVPEAEQEYMFRMIGRLTFSSKLEIDVDIFRDYF